MKKWHCLGCRANYRAEEIQECPRCESVRIRRGWRKSLPEVDIWADKRAAEVASGDRAPSPTQISKGWAH